MTGQALLLAASGGSLLLLALLRVAQSRAEDADSAAVSPASYRRLGDVLLGVHLLSLAVLCNSWGVPLWLLGVVPVLYMGLLLTTGEEGQQADSVARAARASLDNSAHVIVPLCSSLMAVCAMCACAIMCFAMPLGMHVMQFIGLVAHPAWVLLYGMLFTLCLYASMRQDRVGALIAWISPVNIAAGTLLAHALCPLILTASMGFASTLAVKLSVIMFACPALLGIVAGVMYLHKSCCTPKADSHVRRDVRARVL